jgi:chorismate mutase
MAARPDSRTRSDLARQRARMDRLNLRLRDLLQQRARLAMEIAGWKAARGLRLADPARERAMLAHLLQDPGEGFDSVTLRKLLRAILAASRAAAVRAGTARATATRPTAGRPTPRRPTRRRRS